MKESSAANRNNRRRSGERNGSQSIACTCANRFWCQPGIALWSMGCVCLCATIVTGKTVGDGIISFQGLNYSLDRWEDIRYSTTPERLHWYADGPSMQRFVAVGHHNVSITFHCRVSTLHGDDGIIYMDFCFQARERLLPLWCRTLNRRESRGEITVGVKRALKVSLTFHPQFGGIASLSDVPPSVSLDDLKFTCKAMNRRGHRRSNLVELFDYRHRFPADPWRPNMSMTFPLKMPGKLPCLERVLEVDPYIDIRYEWAACNPPAVNNFHSSECSSVIDISLTWPAQVLRNGTLYWPYVSSEAQRRLQGRMLRCSVGNQILAIYSKSLTFESKSYPTGVRLQQPSKRQTAYLFDSNQTDVILPVETAGSGVDTRWRWSHNGKQLQYSDRSTGQCFLTNKGLLRCRGAFSRTSDSNYSITLEPSGKLKSPGPSSREREGTYVIEMKGYPKVSRTMESAVFVVDGMDGRVACQFEKAGLVVPSITISGYDLDFGSRRSLAENVAQINDILKSVMVPLNVSINLVRPQKGQSLVYTARRMVYRSSQHGHRSSSHYVECVGYRQGYSVRHAVVLKVVPRPKMAVTGTPSESDCGGCHKQIVNCSVRNRAEIEAEGAKVNIVWMLDNFTVDRLDDETRRYFRVSGDGAALTVGPIDSEKAFRRLNGRSVACAVELSHVGRGGSRVFHKASEAKLRTTIRLSLVVNVKESFPDMGTAIICCVFIVAIIIAVAVLYRHRRSIRQAMDRWRYGRRRRSSNSHDAHEPVNEGPKSDDREGGDSGLWSGSNVQNNLTESEMLRSTESEKLTTINRT